MSLADDQRALADALTRSGPRSDGLEMAALLVAKLRFERLVQGSAGVARWFEADPAGFVATFRAYCAEVPSRSAFPAAEARAFLLWMRERLGCPDAPRG